MSTLYDSISKDNDNILETKKVTHNTINTNNNLTLTKGDIVFILNKLRNCKIYGKQTEYFYNLILKLQKIYENLDTEKSL